MADGTGVQVTVELTADDLAMVDVFRVRMEGVRRPQRWQAIATYRAATGQLNGDKVFERLKVLGVIDHRRGGTCWLTDKAPEVQRG